MSVFDIQCVVHLPQSGKSETPVLICTRREHGQLVAVEIQRPHFHAGNGQAGASLNNAATERVPVAEMNELRLGGKIQLHELIHPFRHHGLNGVFAQTRRQVRQLKTAPAIRGNRFQSEPMTVRPLE